ncbi:hypothetical protein Pmani_014317 [Petrolisthes manimaculis]|uniref:Uncharacterized protein n=1 Tax=Petrolisthes manimaculis TaxID=1843537 RepID=A0AAE1PU78_9EUCA|nr:hypothetical protein Pmani_014317 [Petrolisthes manimaculis]
MLLHTRGFGVPGGRVMRSMHQYTPTQYTGVDGPASCGLVYWCGAPHHYHTVNTLMYTHTNQYGRRLCCSGV